MHPRWQQVSQKESIERGKGMSLLLEQTGCSLNGHALFVCRTFSCSNLPRIKCTSVLSTFGTVCACFQLKNNTEAYAPTYGAWCAWDEWVTRCVGEIMDKAYDYELYVNISIVERILVENVSIHNSRWNTQEAWVKLHERCWFILIR